MAQEQNLAWWTNRRNALYVAFTSSTLEVEFEGRKERFRSLNDIERAIGLCNQKIAELDGSTAAIRNVEVRMNDF